MSCQVKIKENMHKNFKDYNIISNKYLDSHNIKTVADEKILKAEAAKKYWKTHDFDIINCQFYDEDKEAKFIQTRKEIAETHGLDQVKKLPMTI